MKEKSKIVKNKEYTKFENLSMLIQGILFGLLVILIVISLFYDGLYIYIEILISILMFVLGYNNYKIYKRLGMSTVYIAFGLLVFGVVMREILNG